MTQANAINAGTAGYQVFDGTNTFSGRTFQAGSGISLTNASGVAGNTTITATGSTPSATIMLSDDFFNGPPTATLAAFYSQLPWIGFNQQTIQSPETNRYGVLENLGFTTSAYLWGVDAVQAPAPGVLLGGGAIVLNWYFKINTLSDNTNRYTLRIGFTDTINADAVGGVYFEYSDNINSGNWVYKTANSASTRTTTNSAVAVTTGWHNFQININAAANSITYSVDGVSLGAAITTNVPTLIVSPGWWALRSAGTIATATFYTDLYTFNQTLTTPR